ncbi:MAG: hypothetical protein VX730_04255 [Pseudomonadota bacterium]|nr:hypothetical protein [Pseudomonadota bacterium]
MKTLIATAIALTLTATAGIAGNNGSGLTDPQVVPAGYSAADSMNAVFNENGQHLRMQGGPFNQRNGCFPLKRKVSQNFHKHVTSGADSYVLVFSENGEDCHGRGSWIGREFTADGVTSARMNIRGNIVNGLLITTLDGNQYFVQEGENTMSARRVAQ